MVGERIGPLSPEARHQVIAGAYGVLRSELTAGLAGGGKEVIEDACRSVDFAVAWSGLDPKRS
jgi:hypothetical protein